MLSFITFNVIMLSVVMLNVIMLSVTAPKFEHLNKIKKNDNDDDLVYLLVKLKRMILKEFFKWWTVSQQGTVLPRIIYQNIFFESTPSSESAKKCRHKNERLQWWIKAKNNQFCDKNEKKNVKTVQHRHFQPQKKSTWKWTKNSWATKSWSQSYKTFYACNWHIFVIS